MMPAATVDAYLAGIAPERRALLEQMRAATRAGAPDATETIAYAMPALRSSDGQFVLSYDAYKQHVSLFPASDVVVAEVGAPLARYVSGKGTIRFPSSEPLPLDLVKRIAAIRWREVQARPGRTRA
jgi:uncharacterized protein YdhG (YjbR/CyaY superfamily)